MSKGLDASVLCRACTAIILFGWDVLVFVERSGSGTSILLLPTVKVNGFIICLSVSHTGSQLDIIIIFLACLYLPFYRDDVSSALVV